MSFSDTAQVGIAVSEPHGATCFMCDRRSMLWDGKQWNCKLCSTFYVPLKPPPYLPRRLGGLKEIKRVCMQCRRTQVFGRRLYCERCYDKRRAEQRRLKDDAIANSPLRAEALTNAHLPFGYGGSGKIEIDVETGVAK
jgi:hypothetical protein